MATEVTERALLDRLLDELVPASRDGRIPAAGVLGVADFVTAAVEQDEEFAELFREGLSHAMSLDAPTRSVVAQLETERPAFFAALLRHTYMGYYSRPDIRPLFGLSAQPTQPDGYAVPAEAPQDIAALVEPVVARGPCFRNC